MTRAPAPMPISRIAIVVALLTAGAGTSAAFAFAPKREAGEAAIAKRLPEDCLGRGQTS